MPHWEASANAGVKCKKCGACGTCVCKYGAHAEATLVMEERRLNNSWTYRDEGPSVGAKASGTHNHEGVEFGVKAGICKKEVSNGRFSASVGLNADTGRTFSQQNVGLKVAGFGGKLGSDGVSLDTPIFGVKF